MIAWTRRIAARVAHGSLAVDQDARQRLARIQVTDHAFDGSRRGGDVFECRPVDCDRLVILPVWRCREADRPGGPGKDDDVLRLDRRTFDPQLGHPFAADAFQEEPAVRAGCDRRNARRARLVDHRIDHDGIIEVVVILPFLNGLEPVIERPVGRRADLDDIDRHPGDGTTLEVDDPAGDRYIVAGQLKGQLPRPGEIVRHSEFVPAGAAHDASEWSGRMSFTIANA